MSQALNVNDMNGPDSSPLSPGANRNAAAAAHQPNDASIVPPANANAADASADADDSKLQSTLKSIKDSTSHAAKQVSEKSKERLSMEGQLKQARISLEKYVNPKILNKQISEDTTIPKWVLKRAKGLVFLSVIKAGFLFAGNIGTGVIIVRKPNGGWTGPSSIGVGGISFGFLAGASKVDYIMILPDERAVQQFTGKGQLRLGGELQLAVGPVGRDGSGSVGAGDKGVSVIYSYSHAQGLYGGLALDGKVISVRPDCNKVFYKRSVSCADILHGAIDAIPSNEDYDMLVHLLDSYCLDDDMTPIQGEKLSIEDLNKSHTHGNGNGKDAEHKNNDDGAAEPGANVMHRLSSGFSRLTTNVSQKWLQLTGADDHQNDNNNNNGNDESVTPALHKAKYKEVSLDQKNAQASVAKAKDSTKGGDALSNAQYQIGDDADADDDEQ